MNKVHARRARTGRLAAPLKVSYLSGDGLQIITGQVEFGQREDLTHTFGENTQSVVRQVQALQLGKPGNRERTCDHKAASAGLREPHLSPQVLSAAHDIGENRGGSCLRRTSTNVLTPPFTFACIFVLAERFVASQEDPTYQESKC